MILHDHSKVRYSRISTYIGGAYTVHYDGKMAGHVMQAKSGWGYLPLGADSGKGWIAAFPTRKDATDHLLSANSPSAAWLA